MLVYLAPFVGAVALEVFHWYQLREKLDSAHYKRLLRSKSYWIITVLTVLVGGTVVLIYFQGRLTAAELLVAGAAIPTLFKKLVATFTATQQTKLGPKDEDKAKWSDYFAYS